MCVKKELEKRAQRNAFIVSSAGYLINKNTFSEAYFEPVRLDKQLHSQLALGVTLRTLYKYLHTHQNQIERYASTL